MKILFERIKKNISFYEAYKNSIIFNGNGTPTPPITPRSYTLNELEVLGITLNNLETRGITLNMLESGVIL